MNRPAVNEELIAIGDLAKSLGLTTRTLRYWEEAGMIVAAPRSEGSNRFYSKEIAHPPILLNTYLKGLFYGMHPIKPVPPDTTEYHLSLPQVCQAEVGGWCTREYVGRAQALVKHWCFSHAHFQSKCKWVDQFSQGWR